MAPDQPRNKLDLFYRLNLLHQERLKLESEIPFLDGVLIRAVNINDFIAVDQDKFSLVRKKFWQLRPCRFEVPFRVP